MFLRVHDSLGASGCEHSQRDHPSEYANDGRKKEEKMIGRITFAALSAAVVLGGAAAPAAGNTILGGYLGPPVADQTPAAGQKSEARKVKAAAPASQHARKANASAPASQHARKANASA